MSIYIMGDIHGSFKPIRDFHLRHNTNKEYIQDNNKVMILLGDAGLNYFFNERDENFKKKLGKYPFTYFVIRGNHEERPSICAEKNPNEWHKESAWGNWVWIENKYPYIKYAMDYVAKYYIPHGDFNWEDDIENIPLYETLVIPGAYSVDKYKRLQEGWSWFPQEQLSKSEMLAGKTALNIFGWDFDLILSHTCPRIFEPTDLFLPTTNQALVEKDMEIYLGELEYKLNYKAWLWGHYHAHREYPRDIIKPSFENPRQLMLFNEYAVELTDVMENKNTVIKL